MEILYAITVLAVFVTSCMVVTFAFIEMFDSDNDALATFAMFSMCVYCIAVVCVVYQQGGMHASYVNNREMVQKCEQELPRNKHCKLVAVVDEGLEDE